MALGHFRRRVGLVRIGWPAWLDPFAWWSGWYTVGPLSTFEVLDFIEQLGVLARAVDGDGSAPIFQQLVERVPALAFKPLIPLLVREHIDPRHLQRITVEQVEDVLEKSQKANDFEYLMKPMKPDGGRRVGIEVMVVSIAERLHADPYDLLKRPMQELFAIGDAMAELNHELSGEPEQGEPLTAEDHNILRWF